ARSDSAMFSARSRHAAHCRNRGSPSFHILVLASYTRGLTAMLNRHSAAPPGVIFSSGLSVRFPTAVIVFSFTVPLLSFVFSHWFRCGGGSRGSGGPARRPSRARRPAGTTRRSPRARGRG